MNFGLVQLVDFVADFYMWGSKQCLTLWRDNDDNSVEIKSVEEVQD